MVGCNQLKGLQIYFLMQKQDDSSLALKQQNPTYTFNNTYQILTQRWDDNPSNAKHQQNMNKCITGTTWNKEEEVESEQLTTKESCIS